MLDLVVVERKGFTMMPGFTSEMDLDGKYVVVTKCRGGYPVTSIVEASSPYKAFSRYQSGAILNISFINENVNHNFTLYARQGKKVWIAPELAKDITVGDINDGKVMSNTSLYSQEQYQAVNAKTWASKVFIKN